jgi:hypothetical protein
MGGITKAFENAFERMREQRWEYIYVLIDIHGTIFESDYSSDCNYNWLGNAKEALQMMSDRNDICLILWSGTHSDKLTKYWAYMVKNGIVFDYMNSNPEVGDTDIYSKEKIYFNVGIDDKFGFEPETDWDEIINFLESHPCC